MKKSHILFGLAILAVVLYGIGKYDTNTVCYEIIPTQGKIDTILLDKCKGRTLTLVKEDFDSDDDGKNDAYTYRWSNIRFIGGGEPMWEMRK